MPETTASGPDDRPTDSFTSPIEEVRADLDRLGIDTGPAVAKVLEAVRRHETPDALTVDERAAVERVRTAPLRERPGGKGNYVLVQFSQSDRDALLGLVARIEKRLAEVEAERDGLQTENMHLRAALAHSKDPCRYCQLPAAEMAKCKSGFPGCGRADDMTGCPEFGASLNEYLLREELAAARAAGPVPIPDEVRKAAERIMAHVWSMNDFPSPEQIERAKVLARWIRSLSPPEAGRG